MRVSWPNLYIHCIYIYFFFGGGERVYELKSKSEDGTSVGISAPGSISNKTGLIKNSNTQCLIGKPLKEDLSQALNQEIKIENDANCFAKAEAKKVEA